MDETTNRNIICCNGPYFFGPLVKDVELERIARERAKKYYEERINKALWDEYSEKKWIIHKERKNSIIIHKAKEPSELLEDKTWILFKKLGFKEMNKDRNFKIKAGSITKQIDVYAKDDHNIFIIFCTSQETVGPSISLKGKIHEISDLKKDIAIYIKKYYSFPKEKKIKISFLLVTKNILWSEIDKDFAIEKGIFVWKDEDLEAYVMLAEQLGHAAKYQMYALLFPGKTFDVGEITVPAMYGGKGNKYYCFLIQPEKLFKIAYVHRREKSNPRDVGKTYQRMVNKKRLEDIGKFIDEGNSFQNNIIISFKRRPYFEPHPKIKEEEGISYGILKFPPYYGCAWVIDGQHRLYGYSKSKHSTDPKHTLPVIAFESLSIKDQANLFVNINEGQQSVNQNLLWDLYPDIYENSEDEKQQILRTISLVAKKLNSDEDSVFHNRIQIPNMLIKSKEEANLTLTNICDGIKDNRLINREEGLLFNEDYDKSVNFAAEIIKAYFESIVSFLINDWEKGERGLLQTNVGIRIFFSILRQLLRHLDYKGKENIYRKKDLIEFKNETKKILAPIIEKLSKMNERDIDEIRRGSTKGLVVQNVQKLVWDLKESFGFGLELWNNKNAWNPGIPKEETDDNILRLIDDTEINLRNMIIESLKTKYKENWWKQGIPETIKSEIKKNIEQYISKYPWKKPEMDSLSNEEKLKFSLTSNLKEIIINGNNWKCFEKIFYKWKECVMVQFDFFGSFRNAYKHPERTLDEFEKGHGYYVMGWIRRCMGLNPKKII